MYVPFFSTLSKPNTRWPERRQRGGGAGGASSGGSSGGSGSRGGGSVSGGISGGGSSRGGVSGGGSSSGVTGGGARSGSAGSSIPIKSASGTTSNVRPYGPGYPRIGTIPQGQPFSGRSIGGGTRSDIFGTRINVRQYGSGYLGGGTVSVVGLGFPFGFWPITFGAAGLAAGSQFHPNEYGEPNNKSRPGGPLFDAAFQPPDGFNTYRILSDNTTVQSLIGSVTSNCSLRTTSISAVPFNDSDPFQPKPGQVIQYYRSSSIALGLDGYNNSAAFSNDSDAPNTPLPSNLNLTFLDCLNQTIGAAAPLFEEPPLVIIGSAAPRIQVSGLLALAWMILCSI